MPSFWSSQLALGFVDDNDDYGALLFDRGNDYDKEWVFDSSCSFYFCGSSQGSMLVTENNITFPNNKTAKLEDIGEAIETYDIVKERLGDVKYVLSLKRILYHLGDLEQMDFLSRLVEVS